MTREEQEKLGKEIVKEFNSGIITGVIDKYSFKNIKQFHFIKILDNPILNNYVTDCKIFIKILPENIEGDSLLEIIIGLDKVYFESRKVEMWHVKRSSMPFYYCCNIYERYSKFNLTGNYLNIENLDFWIINSKKFNWVKKYLKKSNFEYNLAMYELFGINRKSIRSGDLDDVLVINMH